MSLSNATNSGCLQQYFVQLVGIIDSRQFRTYMTDSDSNPSLDNCDFEPVIVMKDFMKECSTQNSTEGTFKMMCALCKTRGDPATFFGRFCTVECAKTDKMFKNCSGRPTQNSRSNSGSIVENADSRSQSPDKHQSDINAAPQSLKSHTISNDVSSVGSTHFPPQNADKHSSYNSPAQQSFESSQTMPEHTQRPEKNTSASAFHTAQEARQSCIVCGKETNGKLLCSKECIAYNARHVKLARNAQSPRKCSKCNLLVCECILSNDNMSELDSIEQVTEPAPMKRKRQACRNASDGEDKNGSGTIPTTNNDSCSGKLRKRQPSPRHDKFRKHASASVPRLPSNNSNWTNHSKWDEWRNFFTPRIRATFESESVGPEIRVGNVRSVNHQNGDPPRYILNDKWTSSNNAMSTQQRKFTEGPRILKNPEHACHDSQEQSAAGNNKSHCGCSCHGDVPNCSTKDATNPALAEKASHGSNNHMESESGPTNHDISHPCHLDWDANFARRPPITEEDFKRGVFLQENSEIHRLQCEEIKSRIAVNRAKQLFFESELEKSRLEQKVLVHKLNCGQRIPFTGYQNYPGPPNSGSPSVGCNPRGFTN